MSEYKAARSRTRQKIESAFWKLYLEKDFRRVTVREIVQEAGIHRSTFYQYYESVGDIFDGIKVTYKRTSAVSPEGNLPDYGKRPSLPRLPYISAGRTSETV